MLNLNMQQPVSPLQMAIQGYNGARLSRMGEQEHGAKMEGYQAETEAAQARKAQIEAEQARIQRGQTALSELAMKVQDGSWSARDFYNIQLLHPDYAKHASGVFDAMTSEQKRNGIGTLQKIAIAAATDPDAAYELMETEALALENAGNARGAQAARAQAELLRRSPESFMTSTLGQLAAGMPSDEFEAFTDVIRPMPSYSEETDRMRLEHDIEQDGVDQEYQEGRDAVDDNQWLTDFTRRVEESDREFGLDQERLELEKAEAAAKASEEDSIYSSSEIKSMREKGEMLTSFQNSLDSYIGEIESKGVQALDIGGRNKKAARLDAMRQDLLFQGKGLWELGVLSKDDYENMERAIPDATGIGTAINGKKVALEKSKPLQDSIAFQLDRIPEEYRSYKPPQPREAAGTGTVLREPGPAPGTQVDDSELSDLPDGTVVQDASGKQFEVIQGQLREIG
jgi:hypothetical protein